MARRFAAMVAILPFLSAWLRAWGAIARVAQRLAFVPAWEHGAAWLATRHGGHMAGLIVHYCVAAQAWLGDKLAAEGMLPVMALACADVAARKLRPAWPVTEGRRSA